MKRNAVIIFTIISTTFILLILGLLLNQHIKRINNRNRLEEVASSKLPQLPEFEMINVLSEDFEDSIDGSCFYSRNYYSMGSSLTEDAAITMYLQSLEELGWQYARFSTSSLRYGENTRVSISGWRSSNVLLYSLVPEEMISEYESIIVVTVTYIIPQSGGC